MNTRRILVGTIVLGIVAIAYFPDRIERLFTRLTMNEFRHGRCDKLSTGQKQRVSIARTLVHDPPVMILDEPTNGLDVLAARTIVQFIRECREQGKTVIFSSHVMSEVARLCDRIAIIHQGRMRVTVWTAKRSSASRMGQTRGLEPGEVVTGVVRTAGQGRRRDHQEALGASDGLIGLELFGRHEPFDGRIKNRRSLPDSVAAQ